MVEGNMNKQKSSKLPWIIVGVLALLVIAGGIFIFQSQNSASQNAQGSGPSGQVRTMMRNPAIQAASEIMRLQRSGGQNALTSDQTAKLKPILQNLINTGNPSQTFLQQQADAINAVFTSQQKSFLSSQRNNFRGNYQGGGNGPSGSPNGGGAQGGNGTPGNGGFRYRGNGQGGKFQPADIYKLALNALK